MEPDGVPLICFTNEISIHPPPEVKDAQSTKSADHVIAAHPDIRASRRTYSATMPPPFELLDHAIGHIAYPRGMRGIFRDADQDFQGIDPSMIAVLLDFFIQVKDLAKNNVRIIVLFDILASLFPESISQCIIT